MNKVVLVVDDEIEICEIIEEYLLLDGFKVETCSRGDEVIKMFLKVRPALIILDIMLPGVDGIELCKEIREKDNVPIIMISARNSDIDKILSLGFGADDYVTKPFSPSELVARVKANIRRHTKLNNTNKEEDIIYLKDFKIDSRSYTVEISGVKIELSSKEFEILLVMAKNPGKVFTKENLFNSVWGYKDFGDINTVTVHIRKLREKIEKDPSKPKYLKTLWGVGYKFVIDEGEQ